MGEINRYFKYQYQPYVHTQVEYPFEELLKLGAIQEDRANKNIELQDKLSELLSSIPYAPGHEDYHLDVVRGLGKELENIVDTYNDPTDPNFSRALRRFKSKVLNDQDIKNLTYSYDVYNKQWLPILNDPRLKGSIFIANGIIDPKTGEFIQNRQRYGNLDYIPVENFDTPIDQLLEKHKGELRESFGKLEKEGYKIMKDEKTGAYVFADQKGRAIEYVKDNKTFAPVVKAIANLVETESQPWSRFMYNKFGKNKEAIENYIINRSIPSYGRNLIQDTRDIDYSPMSGGNSGDNSDGDKDKYVGKITGKAYKPYSINPFPFDINFNLLEKTIDENLSIKDDRGGSSSTGKVISNFIQNYKVIENPKNETQAFNKFILDNTVKKLRKEYPNFDNLNKIEQAKKVEEVLKGMEDIETNDQFYAFTPTQSKKETDLYFPQSSTGSGQTVSGLASYFMYYDPDNPNESPRKVDQIENFKNGNTIRVIGDLPYGSYLTRGYKGKVIEVGGGNSTKTYYLADTSPDKPTKDNPNPPTPHKQAFIASASNLLNNANGVDFVGPDRIPMSVSSDDNGKNYYIEYFNPNNKKTSRKYFDIGAVEEKKDGKTYIIDGYIKTVSDIYNEIYNKKK
jgi:hypothetical protein